MAVSVIRQYQGLILLMRSRDFHVSHVLPYPGSIVAEANLHRPAQVHVRQSPPIALVC